MTSEKPNGETLRIVNRLLIIMAIINNTVCETVFLEFLDIYASFVLLHGEAAAVGFQKRDAKNALGGNGSVSEILFVSKRCVALVHNSKQHPFLGSSTTELYTRFLTSISIIARADLSQLKMPLQLHKIEPNSDKICSKQSYKYGVASLVRKAQNLCKAPFLNSALVP